jgi:hypothetical protein
MRRGALIALVLCFPGEAAAQLFSPGKLSEAHAHLEGLSSCTKCHRAGERLSNELCLDCHTELGARIQAAKGYHGRLPASERRCERCHHEHQGLDFPLIDWNPDAFDHAETGWNLGGAHRKLACKDCHDARLIQDAGVRKLLARAPGKRTHLGLSTRCNACHFDEHRGQEGEDCDGCHDTGAWSPAKKFDHDRTEFRLAGKHTGVSCEKCHPSEPDRSTPRDAFPAPSSTTFVRYAPVEHDRCSACHRDPHAGRFGSDCGQCHTEESWTRISRSLELERAFHEETRYPLRGAHVGVACKACHLPLGARALRYRGLSFSACSDCHPDAHFGQLRDGCDRCHSADSFSTPIYGAEAHLTTDYPLEGAHRAVACRRCHQIDQGLAIDPALSKALRLRGRRPLVSQAKLALPAPEGCDSCHDDPHRGQLEAACSDCHRTTDFSDLSFDHRTSRFPLTGAHEKARCDRCHRVLDRAEGAIRYRPLSTECASCHPDPHAAQFSAACSGCHRTESFAEVQFDHSTSRFPLEGRHAQVSCERCHPLVTLPDRREVRRYRPLPLRCDGCHADFHQGAFREAPP